MNSRITAPSLATSASLRDARTPERVRILGVPITLVDYERAMDVMDRIVDRDERGYVCAVAVHAVVTAEHDPELRAALEGATMVVPDGMPLVWAARALGHPLRDRVYGPELMARYLDRCARRGRRVWLYGGHDAEWLERLERRLLARYPGLEIAGSWSPPHRPLSEREERELAARINHDDPDVVWVGIGAPKQEKWMSRMRERLDARVLCGVGAAFDFHAGRVQQAPRWMQEVGLEWVWRSTREPRRLLPRYLTTNPRFVARALYQIAGERARRRADAAP